MLFSNRLQGQESTATIVVQQFQFEGNTKVPTAKLTETIAPFLNRPLTTNDLEKARVSLAELYRQSGIPEASVTLPDQDPSKGTVLIKIEEAGPSAAAVVAPELPEDMMILAPEELAMDVTTENLPEVDLRKLRLEEAKAAMRPVLPPATWPKGTSLATADSVFVKQFKFSGNRAVSSGTLALLLKPFTGREITPEELEEARTEVTRYYVNKGFITSGAVIPDQDISSGKIKIEVVEGRISEVEVSGNKWFRTWWLQQRLRGAAGSPVNINRLRTQLQLMRENPTVTQINAELLPGIRNGESILEVKLQDSQPFQAGFVMGNTRPPSVGEGIGELYFTDLNTTGHNDILNITWGLLQWSEDSFDYAGFDNFGGSYDFPISPWGTRLTFYGSKSDTSIIDETFAELGITGKSYQVGVSILQPVVETLKDRVLLSFAANWEESDTFLLGEPFSLSPGEEDGESKVFVLRFGTEWTNRSQAHVLTMRSTFNFGLPEFGASEAPSGSGYVEIPDSDFFFWLLQTQYVRRLFEEAEELKPEALWAERMRRGISMSVRSNLQVANNPLLSLEQFSLGGLESVRGYRENQILRDNGVFASFELIFPVYFGKDGNTIASLVTFFDVGAGWDVGRNDDFQELYSTGLGLSVEMGEHAKGRIFWGFPFVDFDEKKESLQDYGIEFELSLSLF